MITNVSWLNKRNLKINFIKGKFGIKTEEVKNNLVNEDSVKIIEAINGAGVPNKIFKTKLVHSRVYG